MRCSLRPLQAILTVSLLVLSAPDAPPARAGEPTTLYPIVFVAPDGDDAQECDTPATRCVTLQRALAQLAAGGEARLAGGSYPGVTTVERPAVIAGGYDLPDFRPGGPRAVLDGLRAGSTLRIAGPEWVRLRRLTITGGLATSVGPEAGQGGGIYARGADVILDGVTVQDNIASTADVGQGGGVYVGGGSLTLLGSRVASNVALLVQLAGWQPVPIGGASAGPVASRRFFQVFQQAGSGGGIYAVNASVSLQDSQIANNRAVKISEIGPPGGVVYDDIATPGTRAYGGGLYAEGCLVQTHDASFVANRALAGSGTSGSGGAIRLINSQAHLSGGAISDNRASSTLRVQGAGGGIDILGGVTTVTGVALWRNAATPNDAGQGAGILVRPGAPPPAASTAITLTNVLLAGQRGTALALLPGQNGATARADVRYATLVSNTIGMQAGDLQSIAVSNSVIVGSDMAVQALAGGTIALRYTDRYGNTVHADGDVVVGPAGDLTVPPGFAPPSGAPFRLAADSPLVDRGTPIEGIDADFEGQPRALDGDGDGVAQPDLGWDELARSAAALGPNQTLFALPGQVLTTTVALRNEGLAADEFEISAAAPEGWGASAQPAHVALRQRGRVPLVIVIAVPAGAPPNSQGTITIRARGRMSAAAALIVVDVGEP